MPVHSRALTIFYCGKETCLQNHSFGPAVRQHYLLHFVLKGKGHYQVLGNDFEVTANQCFLIRPGETTFYIADCKDPWEYVWIAFNGAEAERLLEDYGFTPPAYIRNVTNRSEYIEKINEIFLEKGLDQDALTGILYYIFSGIAKDNARLLGPADKGYFDESIQYIKLHFSYNIAVTDVAGHVGIERTYLYKIFMKYKGISPKDCITFYRLKNAEDLLLNTKLNITEVALSSGFHDVSMFSKAFKTRFGIPPLQYRARAHR